jgi:copper ion binding protein
MTSLTLSVPDISCGHCKSSIEGAVRELSGIDAVDVHIEERTVDVTFDDATVDRPAIVAAIEGQGYEVAE